MICPDRILFIDIETSLDGRLREVGAVLGSDERHWNGKEAERVAMVRGLDEMAAKATAIAGHNILAHDLPRLAALLPEAAFLRLPPIDTLLLSPLAFPRNPYHHLVKGYKLVRDSVNDPVADSRLARALLVEQMAELAKQPVDLLDVYHYCFSHGVLENGGMGQGMAGLLEDIGVVAFRYPAEALAAWLRLAGQGACRRALARLGTSSFIDGGRLLPLCYALAWLRVAGGNSVLPPWVRKTFPRTAELLKILRDTPCDDPDCGYCRQHHDALHLLKSSFGFDAYRPEPQDGDGASLQQRIVEAGLRNEPLLAILPTGGGKSLCFQVPALARYARRGLLTVVISPLQALMADQVENLAQKTGTTCAAALSGMLTPPERADTLDRVRLGDVGILYLSPEQLRNRSTQSSLAQREIGCWVFDEAHCLSKWGHDFRPDYLYAVRYINENAPAPVACFTATAKLDVVEEITTVFRQELAQELTPFLGGVERGNLSYSIHPATPHDKADACLGLLAEHLDAADADGCAVVYCRTRKATESMAGALSHGGWSADFFHAGRSPREKMAVQGAFAEGRLKVVCATNAFGMGIDKDSVRLVLHADIPGSLENYLQEAGRAGRDCQPAHCALLFDPGDVDAQFKLNAFSELSHKDIVQILRGLRGTAKRVNSNQVVLTPGELLAENGVEVDFAAGEPGADTKVKTAIAWLERSALAIRDSNDTQVAAGRPKLVSMTAFERAILPLGLSPQAAAQWRCVYAPLVAAAADTDQEEMVSVDSLARAAAVREAAADPQAASHLVLALLGEMERAGLIEGGAALSALIRPARGADELRALQAMERALVDWLREAMPDGDEIHLSLRAASQHLRNQGHDTCRPEVLRRICKTLNQGERSPLGWLFRLRFRPRGGGFFAVTMPADWSELLEVIERRHVVATLLHEGLLGKLAARRAQQAVVHFTLEEMSALIRADMLLAADIADPFWSVQSVLITLHDWKLITLQQGLAIFRQAMTVTLPPVEGRARSFLRADYEPLSQHYKGRTLQVHVMEEFARKGLDDPQAALRFASDYFELSQRAFSARHLKGLTQDFARPLSPALYRCIVTNLGNAAQEAIVTASADRNLLVLAGPGSGKTRVIVHRAAYLLRVQRVAAPSLLVLCFNRSSASSVRGRLRTLIGDDAAHVDVFTYHALSMRLLGLSLENRGRDFTAEVDETLKTVVATAASMLEGEIPVPGLDSGEVRERLLAHYRYILIDEYQDIDEHQYRLVSAIVGRTKDDDERIALMAVGDDDQAVYGFRDASVTFIHRFQEDYAAERHYLVENFRSTAAIISAANTLIAANRQRMKAEHPIRIDAARAAQPAGGAWVARDSLVKGQVQRLEVADAPHQAVAVLAEIRRLRTLDPGLNWGDFAVLAPTRDDLLLLRALCEEDRIPVAAPSEERGFPLPRLREVRVLLDRLTLCGQASITVAALTEDVLATRSASPWQPLVAQLLEDCRLQAGGGSIPAPRLREIIYESLSQMRRERSAGDAVFLSTLHGAKGLEFPHVFLLDGRWLGQDDPEEIRRLFYVGMTRARESLCLLKCRGSRHPHLGELEGTVLLRTAGGDGEAARKFLGYRTDRIALDQLFIDFAGQRLPSHPIHRALAGLEPGQRLDLVFPSGVPHGELHDGGGVTVARLSERGTILWRERANSIARIAVHAMVRRLRDDTHESYRNRLSVEEWDLPVLEVWWRKGMAGTI